MRFDKNIISHRFRTIFLDGKREEKLKSAKLDLLDRMGFHKDFKDIPYFIENSIEQVINPYLVAKMHSEKGFPKEMMLETISAKLGIEWEKYWSDWCDFWFNSFIKIPHDNKFFKQ